jgi:putative membrane protein
MATQTGPRTLDVSTALAYDRTRLAYERTLMAWVRTGVSLVSLALLFTNFFKNFTKQNTSPKPAVFSARVSSDSL